MVDVFFGPLTFDISPFAMVRIFWIVVSTTVTGVFLFLTSRKKIILNHYLHGTWEGYLIDQHNNNYVIHCTLYVNYQHNLCKGTIIYESRSNGSTYSHGVDKLLSYDDDDWFPKSWNPLFERVFHRYIDTNSLLDNKSSYGFNCNLRKRFSKNLMDVTLNLNNKQMKGVWQRIDSASVLA